ncbi:GMC family oxidoreductase [Salipiger sp.]|uniref:GMC family oxidoreductase n=1 Tax=Salipiger sp. TaxID=2078585 RepID=UPI003A96D6E0
MTDFDFIVVGSGSAGGVVAARLSESGKYSVLCLEAGEKGENYIFSIPPLGNAYMIDNPAVSWCYTSDPGASIANRSLAVPRGKLLGGSSAINGTTYNRGLKIDYDTWAQMGCRGWSFDEVLPILKRIESTELGSDEFRGRSGPVKVIEAKPDSPFFDLFIKACERLGIPRNPDYSGASQEGVAMVQQTVYRGLRQSTATQYLKPARNRANLKILSGAEATKLLFEGKTCVGVTYRHKGAMHEARALREVIVSSGAANSPKLLELSGIGDSELLSRHGIPVVRDVKGVGANLRDHFAAHMKWTTSRPGISIARRGRGWRLGLEVLKWVLFRRGFITQGLGAMRVFARSRPDLEEPDMMLFGGPFLIETRPGKPRRMSRTDGFFIYAHPERTETTGSIHIRSNDPFAPPRIDFRFLETEGDRRISVAAVRLARKIVETSPLSEVVGEELEPGRHVQSDEEIIAFIREKGVIPHHMVGTCKMGTDPMAVVDERLRVHGISGLRVADASIMPTITSGNTSIPCMMIGEKCAEMVLADAGS